LHAEELKKNYNAAANDTPNVAVAQYRSLQRWSESQAGNNIDIRIAELSQEEGDQEYYA
jgi:hypothetical protein